mgnify:CR=1 FL=1
MNFYKTLGLKNSRIDVADALRGLAVWQVLFSITPWSISICTMEA